MNDLQRKATKQKIKNIIKASGIQQSKQKHIDCSPLQFAFQSSRVCAFCFWIFKINFLRFWSREQNLNLVTGERSAFMVILSGSMEGWGWTQEGSRGDPGTGRSPCPHSSARMWWAELGAATGPVGSPGCLKGVDWDQGSRQEMCLGPETRHWCESASHWDQV